VLLDRQDPRRLTAVLDWEMATVGDPLTDVALLLVYQRLPGLGAGYAAADACTAPGFLSAGELLGHYAAHSERDLPAMGFYLALACFKLAVIHEGIHYRHTRRQTVGAGFDTVGSVVEPLIEAGLAALKEQ
jgi:aminoglycoside phosphotransferase (APT) family kinase protein